MCFDLVYETRVVVCSQFEFGNHGWPYANIAVDMHAGAGTSTETIFLSALLAVFCCLKLFKALCTYLQALLVICCSILSIMRFNRLPAALECKLHERSVLASQQQNSRVLMAKQKGHCNVASRATGSLSSRPVTQPFIATSRSRSISRWIGRPRSHNMHSTMAFETRTPYHQHP